MCMEDINIGRLSPDQTRSLRGNPESLTAADVLVIPANQTRVGLFLSGIFNYALDAEGSTTFADGYTEIWVDDPVAPDEEGEAYSHLFTVLTNDTPRIFLRIEEYGLLVQRKFTLRPVIASTFGTPFDLDYKISFTEIVFPELSKYQVVRPSNG